MTGITGVERDPGPRGDVGFCIEEHRVDLAGAQHQQVAAVDIDRGPVREDLHRALARIDLEGDVRRNDDRIARRNRWISVVRAADREVVRAGGSRVRALGGGPGCGRRIVEIGGDGATGHGGWQHAGRQRMAVRLHPVDTAGGEHDGSDADGHPVFPGGAQQKTRGRSRQLEPAKYV